MKVCVQGRSTIRGLLEAAFRRAGHPVCALEGAEAVIDCGGSLPMGDGVRVLALCYASSATVYAQRMADPTLVTGFSCVPTKTAMSLIELTRPWQGSTQNLGFWRDFFEGLGLETITVPDSPGLVVARTVACLANEAFAVLASGIADARTVDTAMRLGMNYPLGPLEWAELIGLADTLAILEALTHELGERYRPHPLLRRLVAANLSVAAFEHFERAQG